MKALTENQIRKMVRDVIKESLILEISTEDRLELMSKSNQRVPFNSDLMKQAITQGREIGLGYRSKNDKYEMPIMKYRIIHPVAMGTDKKGSTIIRGLHIAGQSEKAARETGVRSAEVEAEKDGMNAWRLFKLENLKSMWFTGRFFSDEIPGYNPNDKAMSTIVARYNPSEAKEYQDQLVANSKQPQTQAQPKEQPQQQPQQTPVNKDIEQMGYEDQPIQEKNIRGFFK